MKKLYEQYHFWLGLLIVLIVSSWVCMSTYQPGTYLSGWDTLHPEFDLSLYTQRVIFGSWQEHQGLGAPASQAHLAELPRLPLLWLLTTTLPLTAVRYGFIFLMYIAGGVGVYLFLTKAWFKPTQPSASIAATLASLAYLLNLGTLQQFYVPLEMFAVHFATLGFVFLTLHQAVLTKQKKWFGLFFMAQVVSAPAAHTATLFYMYSAVIFGYAFILALAQAGRTQLLTGLKTFMLLVIITLMAHAYWLGPNLYYVLAHSEYVREAKISRLFSHEAFWQNQAFGSISNVMILKNFLFNWKDYDFKQRVFVDLLNEWLPHLNLRLGTVLASVTAICSLAGLPLLIKRKNTKLPTWPFLFVVFVPFFFLVNYNFPFTQLYALIRDHSAILEEGLRFPFTKFSILWMFGLAVGLAQFGQWSLATFDKLPRIQALTFKTGLISLLSATILLGNLPALSGHLISDNMKVVIPDEYRAMFAWFKDQPQAGRIVKFPLVTYAGWNYYQWPKSGYQGAGFTWFGLPQPTLDREFDRWVMTDEVFYHELSQSIRNKDQSQFLQLIDKYDISWFLFDRSVIDPQKPDRKPESATIMAFLTQTPGLKQTVSFGSLDIYQIESQPPATWIDSKELTPVQADTHFARHDTVFGTTGHYFESAKPKFDFPWTFLLAERPLSSDLVLNTNTTTITSQVQGSDLILSDWHSTTNSLPVTLYSEPNPITKQINITFQPNYPELYIGDTPVDLQSYAASKSSNVLLPAPATGSAILAVNNQYFEIPATTQRSLIGQTQLYLEDTNVFEILQIIDRANNEVTVETVPNSVNITRTDFQQLLLPEIVLPLSDSTVRWVFPYQPDTKSLASYSTSETLNCNNKIGLATNSIDAKGVIYLSKDKGNACDRFTFPFVRHNQEYLMHVKGENIEGMPLKFNINELATSQPYIEEMLSTDGQEFHYSLLGNREKDGMEFHLASLSFGSVETKNRLESIEFRPLPLAWLAAAHGRDSTITALPSLNLESAQRLNSTLYLAKVSSDKPASLTLSQSYDQGWVAIVWPKAFDQISQSSFLEHARLNNWANMWIVPAGSHTIILIYLPQILAYVGFGWFVLGFGLFGFWAISHWRRRSLRRSTHF